MEGENATSRHRSSDCDNSSKALAVPAPTTATRTLGLPAALASNHCMICVKNGSLRLFWACDATMIWTQGIYACKNYRNNTHQAFC